MDPTQDFGYVNVVGFGLGTLTAALVVAANSCSQPPICWSDTEQGMVLFYEYFPLATPSRHRANRSIYQLAREVQEWLDHLAPESVLRLTGRTKPTKSKVGFQVEAGPALRSIGIVAIISPHWIEL